MKIVFTGGGSGGHIFPLVAVSRELQRMSPSGDVQISYLGPKDELSFIYLKQEGVACHNIIAGKLRRYFSLENILDILKLPIGFVQSFFLLLWIKPALVLGKGGPGSLVVTFAARILGIDVFVHESDAVPGLSNQQSAKFAKKIFTSFEQTAYFDRKNYVVTGNPIRREILEGDISEAESIFALTLTKPILLVLGGSQGAEAINDFVLNALRKLLENYEIIHMTGRKNFKNTVLESEAILKDDLEKYYHPVDFLDEEKIKHAYKAADLVIARAGAGIIFEIAAVGKPSILIPLPSSARHHQFQNAFQYAAAGACLIVEQNNLTTNFFMETLQLIFLNQEKLNAMKQSALAFAKPLAARAVARELLESL